MARVFLAHERGLGRPVVIKILNPELAEGINANRFEREISLAASLQQASIVPLLSAGRAARYAYYTMPFVEGRSLRDRLARDSVVPIGEGVSLLKMSPVRSPTRMALVLSHMSFDYRLTGQLDSALAESRRALETDSTNYTTILAAILVDLASNRLQEAHALIGRLPENNDNRGYQLARTCDAQAAREMLRRLDARPPE